MDGACCFAQIEDSRTCHALKYPLDEILPSAFGTLLSGGETGMDRVDFAEVHLPLLRGLRPFIHGAPSHDTYSGCLRYWTRSDLRTGSRITCNASRCLHIPDETTDPSNSSAAIIPFSFLQINLYTI